MFTLILAVSLALSISAACSLTETVLYSVPWAHIEKLRKEGRPVGQLLYDMRSHVDKPIAAVLTLNTIANTAGSAIAGAAYMAVFGAEYMGIFAAVFTVLVLTFGEIIPKTLGVAYAAPCSTVLAWPLAWMVKALAPIIWLTSRLTRLISSSSSGPQISEDDIRAAASLSCKAGGIQAYEEKGIRNILALDQKHVYDIMTPRMVVFSLPQHCTVREAWATPEMWHFSRIPVHSGDREDLVGMVERRDLARCMTDGSDQNIPLSSLMKPLRFVAETQPLDALLKTFLDSRVHLFAVLDEYGGLAGVVSLEDVLEEILGHEIIDESDQVGDLQELARQRQKKAQERRHDAAGKNRRNAGQTRPLSANKKNYQYGKKKSRL